MLINVKQFGCIVRKDNQENKKHFSLVGVLELEIFYITLLRPYYIAKRTREILISNIHLLSPQKWSQFVHFNIEKVFPRGQP